MKNFSNLCGEILGSTTNKHNCREEKQFGSGYQRAEAFKAAVSGKLSYFKNNLLGDCRRLIDQGSYYSNSPALSLLGLM